MSREAGTNVFAKTVYNCSLITRRYWSIIRRYSVYTDTRDRVRLFILIGGKSENSNSSLFVARSGDIVLPGVYLLLHYVYLNDLDTQRQKNNMIWIVLYSCATTMMTIKFLQIIWFSCCLSFDLDAESISKFNRRKLV